ncbi:hypothetical protein ABW21_db0206590 [Orbilia brochopaga]|nr:hypothetical protein ABW21_db0206590 [Drechslerella brochopaga]
MGSYIPSKEPMLSARALRNLHNRNEYFESLMKLMENTYNEQTNPHGIINLAIAENSFMQKVVYDYLNENLRLEAKQLGYGDGPNGSARLRRNLSKFVNTYFYPVEAVKPEQIVASSGVSGIMDQLVWALCNEGDGILVGKPMYSGFAKGRSSTI